jgi:hypothetical protein
MWMQNNAVYLCQAEETCFDILFCCLQIVGESEPIRASLRRQQLLNDGGVDLAYRLISWLQFRATHSFLSLS